ncbi:alpha/beta fold hydrolase [Nocardia terpenica]|uniref:alpha/beta fold hydrolase n=1 Tax=Nocardia terpenica TaxID=455432 RepID=UPI0009ED5962|nr:alpha/beta fold hydrolase [Nocardia terpenica]
MIASDVTFDGTWPFPALYTEAAGFRQHYIDVGPRGGEPIVLLHGEPTWGYLWRHLIEPLSRTHRVVVPDHMGFGKSETPADRGYLAAEHVDNLEALLVGELDLTGITLVMHDWGGPIGTGFALRHPDRTARLFATNTVVPLPVPGYGELMLANMKESYWFGWAAAAQADGTLEEVLGNAGASICHLMLALQTITHPEIINHTWMHAYADHFPPRNHQPHLDARLRRPRLRLNYGHRPATVAQWTKPYAATATKSPVPTTLCSAASVYKAGIM